MPAQPLVINGATIAGVEVLACIWDEDPPAERTHAGAVQSLAFMDVTGDVAVVHWLGLFGATARPRAA